MDWYTVIPTKNREPELEQLIYSIQANQVGDPHKILVINNSMRDIDPWFHRQATVIHDPNPEPHIYGMWNVGLAWAQRMATDTRENITPHAVAILNDDVELPPDFAAKTRECFRGTGCTIAFPNQGDGIVNTPASDLFPAQRRITGFAFVVNGTHGIRCDTRFKWWYGDDDLDWSARYHFNGTQEISGVTVKHLYPSESTNANPKLIEQTGRDREEFLLKWGKPPW